MFVNHVYLEDVFFEPTRRKHMSHGDPPNLMAKTPPQPLAGLDVNVN